MATDTWNSAYEADPADTDLANLYANRLRNTKVNIRERMEIDHEWEDSSEGGKHKKLTLRQQGSAPSPAADEIGLYVKEGAVSAEAEIFSKNEGGAENQWTRQGQIIPPDQVSVDDPGITGGLNAPADFIEVIEQLKYKHAELRHGNAGRNAADLAAWLDYPSRGVDHLINGALLDNSASGSAPYGWTLAGTPSAIAPETLDDTEGVGRQLSITADAAGEGIEQQVDDLKAGGYYLVEVRVKPATGTWTLETTGASGAVFGNLDRDTSGSSYQTLKGIILVQDPVVPITVRLKSGSSGDVVKIAWASLTECRIDVGDRTPDRYTLIATSDADGTDFAQLEADLQISVVPPSHGWIVLVEAVVQLLKPDSSGSVTSINFGIEEDVDGGGFSEIQRFSEYHPDLSGAVNLFPNISMRHPVISLTPGSVHTYKIVQGPGGPGSYELQHAAGSREHHLIVTLLRNA